MLHLGLFFVAFTVWTENEMSAWEHCRDPDLRALMIKMDEEAKERRLASPLSPIVHERMQELQEEMNTLSEYVTLYTSGENCGMGDLNFKAGLIAIIAHELEALFNIE